MSAPPLFRLVDERRVSVVRDAAAVSRVFDDDPVGSCMVASRVADHGIDPTAIGGELWTRRHADESLCYAGANLIPLRGESRRPARVRRQGDERGAPVFVGGGSCRTGAADVAAAAERMGAGPRCPRDQPLMALSRPPACAVDPAVRRVRVDELDAYLVAAMDMFIGEVGIDPRLGDGGRGYRRRVAGLIAAGRAWARFEHGEVIFKAEVGSESPAVGQIQGVWVHPGLARHGSGHRGHGGVGRCGGVRRPHRQPVRQRLQHGRAGGLRRGRIRRGGHLRHRAARLTAAGFAGRRMWGCRTHLRGRRDTSPRLGRR